MVINAVYLSETKPHNASKFYFKINRGALFLVVLLCIGEYSTTEKYMDESISKELAYCMMFC